MVAAETMADTYEKRVGIAHTTLATLKGAIQELFDKTGCNTAAIMALLGDGGITETNIMSYLSIIEQRVNEVLYAYAHKQQDVEGGNAASAALVTDALVAHPLTAQMATRVIIEPPSTHGEIDEDGNEVEPDDENVPLSRGALESKVQRTLVRKLDNAIKVKQVDNMRKPRR